MEQNSDLAIRLEAIINTAIDGIITIDEKGVIDFVNQAAAKLFGYEVEELVGKRIECLMPEPYKFHHAEYMQRYMTTKEARIIGIGREVTGLKKDGNLFPFRLAVSEVLIKDRILFTGIIHDLTEVKEAETQITKMNEMLELKVEERTLLLEKVINKLLKTNKQLNVEIKEREEAEENLRKSQDELRVALEQERELHELKSRFVSMASHEFRTPLSTILSSASLINRYTKTDQQEKRTKHVNRIKSAISNLTSILNEFLSLSKFEEGKLESQFEYFNLEIHLREIVEEMKGLLKPSQSISCRVMGLEPFEAYTDKRVLRNILMNLISNAIKYSNANTEIETIIIFAQDSVEIQIKDEGIGIPPEEQKHLFSRFFRATNASNIEGTGLGLHIVYHYVQIIKGGIRFTSILDKGSTFVVELPKHTAI